MAVWGLSFKPNTDDIRYAPSLDIIQALQKEGVKIQAYDPEAMLKAKLVFKNVHFAKNLYEAVRGADALAVLTEWDEFTTVDFKRLKKLLRQPIIFDGRNMFNPEELSRMGFQYYGMGRGHEYGKKSLQSHRGRV